MNTLKSSILAGICIGIAGFGYLASPNINGAVLFAFGLLAVVHYGLKLFTGTAGFISNNGIPKLLIILVGNIIGCMLMSLIARCSPLPLQDTAQGILESRLNAGPLRCGVLAIGCGFIMTTAVMFARQGKCLPLLFGVPLFIICGFPHCIADAFYCSCVQTGYLAEHIGVIMLYYAHIVLGNFIGCNLYRIING